MNFPGVILGGISRVFESDMDEILIYILAFLFILLSSQHEDTFPHENKRHAEGAPIIIVAIFLALFLVTCVGREEII